jgi:hypothetical protein
MAISCPRCGLKNPSGAQRCDCGQQLTAGPTTSRQCANCGRALGALEHGVQRGVHLVCAECAPRLDVEAGAQKPADQLAAGVQKHIGTPRQLYWLLILAFVVFPIAAILGKCVAPNSY